MLLVGVLPYQTYFKNLKSPFFMFSSTVFKSVDRLLILSLFDILKRLTYVAVVVFNS